MTSAEIQTAEVRRLGVGWGVLTLSTVAEGCRERRAVLQDRDGRDAWWEALDDGGRLAGRGGERRR